MHQLSGNFMKVDEDGIWREMTKETGKMQETSEKGTGTHYWSSVEINGMRLNRCWKCGKVAQGVDSSEGPY